MSSGRALARCSGPLAVALLLLAAWLFLPQRSRAGPGAPALRVVLVDVSASATRLDPSWLPWVRAELGRQAAAAEGLGQEMAVSAYAQEVATVFPPGAPAELRAALAGRGATPLDPRRALRDDGGTRLDAALGLASGLVRERPGSELVLLGPGTCTGPSPAASLVRLVRAGTPITRVAPPAPELSDLALLELSLPARCEAGAALVATARIQLTRGWRDPGPAELRVELQNAGAVQAFAVPLALPLQDGELELPIACGEAGFGRSELRAELTFVAGRDPLPENDAARAHTLAGGARVLGVVASEELLPAARAWLAPSGQAALPGLEFVFRTPAELAGELDQLAAIVSFDLAPEELPGPLVASFVQEGGGWLACSGWRFLRGWIPGAELAPLTELLPLEPSAPERGARDVVLLVDGSGSMAGEPFELVRTACLDLLAAALPDDRVSLRFFTTRLEPEHLLRERQSARSAHDAGAEAEARAARALLRLRVPQGTTFLLASLEEFARSAGERETLAFLLSDGQERDALPDVVGQAERVRELLRSRQVRLVVVAAGEPNRWLLEALAGEPGQVLAGDSLDGLRAIFQRELRGAQLAEGEALQVSAAPRAPGSLAAEVLAPAEGPALPPLERYVRARLRPGAEVLWHGAESDPVLALQRVGLGRTALFVSLPAPGWAGSWTAHAGLGEPREFEPLLRWLARGPERGRGLEARVEGERLLVAGFAAESPARVPAELLEPATGQRLVTLELLPGSGPGSAPWTQREALLPAEIRRAGLAPLLRIAGEAPGSLLALELGLRDEFAWRERPFELPGDAPGTDAAGPAGAGRSHPAAPWALSLGLCLLLASGLRGRSGQGAFRNSR